MTERNRPQIAITIDGDLLKYVDETAKKLGMTRSKLIENCLAVAVDDLKLLKKLGLIDAVRVIQSFQAKVKQELFAATR
jgi:metal-responsive CopG/Arc/MetJ family transcriptional regulator